MRDGDCEICIGREAARSLLCPYCFGPEHYVDIGACREAHVKAWAASKPYRQKEVERANYLREEGCWEDLYEYPQEDRDVLLLETFLVMTNLGPRGNSILHEWARGADLRRPGDFNWWRDHVEYHMAGVDEDHPEKGLCKGWANLIENQALNWRP